MFLFILYCYKCPSSLQVFVAILSCSLYFLFRNMEHLLCYVYMFGHGKCCGMQLHKKLVYRISVRTEMLGVVHDSGASGLKPFHRSMSSFCVSFIQFPAAGLYECVTNFRVILHSFSAYMGHCFCMCFLVLIIFTTSNINSFIAR